MYGLENILTEDTKIYYLRKSDRTDLKSFYNLKNDEDVGMVHTKDDIDYFFKVSCSGLYNYLVLTINELIGEYYSEILKIRSIKYHIARGERYEIGICSSSFYEVDKVYTYLQSHIVGYEKERYVSSCSNLNFDFFNYLLTLCVDEKNKEEFVDNLLKLFAIDIYMLQRDRDTKNMQFEKNVNTGYFNLAPLYDFEHCYNYQLDRFMIYNSIVELNINNIKKLMNRFDNFHRYLKILYCLPMEEVLNNIFDNYHLNKDTQEYKDLKYNYRLKEKVVQKNLAKLI